MGGRWRRRTRCSTRPRRRLPPSFRRGWRTLGSRTAPLGGDSVMEALTRAAISLLPTCIGEDVLDEGHGEALRRKRRCISSWLGGLRFGRAEERGGFRFLPIWKK
ncbi:unnamed protein product [Musa textilis]